ncbi:hypothetical protein [Burkholderia gladioli]|uniref:hypothetical protein n=1 Tax=Burkholderia gladioli TaxID=28095 RepID=UPI0005C682AD|nr:hypothetical protein [Burkholderia gladioli]
MSASGGASGAPSRAGAARFEREQRVRVVVIGFDLDDDFGRSGRAGRDALAQPVFGLGEAIVQQAQPGEFPDRHVLGMAVRQGGGRHGWRGGGGDAGMVSAAWDKTRPDKAAWRTGGTKRGGGVS